MSGKERPLLATPPLRTVRASFPAYGSSLRKSLKLERPATTCFCTHCIAPGPTASSVTPSSQYLGNCCENNFFPNDTRHYHYLCNSTMEMVWTFGYLFCGEMTWLLNNHIHPSSRNPITQHTGNKSNSITIYCASSLTDALSAVVDDSSDATALGFPAYCYPLYDALECGGCSTPSRT